MEHKSHGLRMHACVRAGCFTAFALKRSQAKRLLQPAHLVPSQTSSLSSFAVRSTLKDSMSSPDSHLQSAMQPQPVSIDSAYKGSGKLSGKVCIITGADSGIGRAVAMHFAKEGAAGLMLCYGDEHSDAEETVACCQKEGAKVVTYAGDVSCEHICQTIAMKCANELGGSVDVLVNNGGGQMKVVEAITDIDSTVLQQTFGKNVFAAFYLVKAMLPILREGGSIINCTSIEAYRAKSSYLDYACSKGALTTFTYGLANAPEILSKRIRVNAVAPGPIWTPLITHTMGKSFELFGKQTPMGRAGQPAEVAPSFVFLASNLDSSYISGQVLHPNGGMTVHG